MALNQIHILPTHRSLAGMALRLDQKSESLGNYPGRVWDSDYVHSEWSEKDTRVGS